MGVCCIVFDIDGMLFEFFMNFLNIEKNKILRIFFLQYFMFSLHFMLFRTLKKKLVLTKFFRGGGGGVDKFYFFRKLIFSHLISCFMLISTLKINIDRCPFTYWLNGSWFLQIEDRIVEIYIHISCS